VVGTAFAVALLHLLPVAGPSAAYAGDRHRVEVAVGQQHATEHGESPAPSDGHGHGVHVDAGACALALPPAAGYGAATPGAPVPGAVLVPRSPVASAPLPPRDVTRAPPDLHRICVSRT
jgi:hypothetical protein